MATKSSVIDYARSILEGQLGKPVDLPAMTKLSDVTAGWQNKGLAGLLEGISNYMQTPQGLKLAGSLAYNPDNPYLAAEYMNKADVATALGEKRRSEAIGQRQSQTETATDILKKQMEVDAEAAKVKATAAAQGKNIDLETAKELVRIKEENRSFKQTLEQFGAERREKSTAEKLAKESHSLDVRTQRANEAKAYGLSGKDRDVYINNENAQIVPNAIPFTGNHVEIVGKGGQQTTRMGDRGR